MGVFTCFVNFSTAPSAWLSLTDKSLEPPSGERQRNLARPVGLPLPTLLLPLRNPLPDSVKKAFVDGVRSKRESNQ